MTIFMKYEGVEGEHSLNGAGGYIELVALSWSMSRSGAAVHSGARARIEPSVSEVTCSKLSDKSSIGLLTEGFTGKFDRKVTISFVRQGQAMLLPYMVYTLTDVGILSFAHGGGADGPPTDSFSLNFSSIDIQYTSYTDDLTGVSANILYNVPQGQ
ncbi:type VI secretion system tube protein Hcp [Belnapia sp. T18]|uniref:Type VI secretion system tube protein Hcp n=1 Tax=Belnapia arida TaxID=2804533 RepID=A0ABS1U1H7_9PROT|nr:type VI secretion system tube protein Hcp [Belnapia arida]MBL6077171.1 type VI secretion system tube protein Hcp [Belnapia arida]